jgi:hypothetical protein
MFKRVVTKPERSKAVVSSPSTAAGPRRPGGDGVQNQKTAHSDNRDDRPHRPRGAPAPIPRFNALDQMALATAHDEVRDVALAAKAAVMNNDKALYSSQPALKSTDRRRPAGIFLPSQKHNWF